MKKDDPACPVIETLKDAIAIGGALAKVMHYDRDWAKRVFQGDPALHYNTGPAVLNNELQSLWRYYTTIDERQAIITAMVIARLS